MNEQPDLDALARDLAALRRAVKTNSPLLRGVAATPFFSWLSLPLGIFVLVFCLGTHFLVGRAGSWASLPEGWKLFLWIAIAAFLVVGGLLKVVFIRRSVARLDGRAGFWRVARLMYGAEVGSVYVASLVAMAGSAAFAATIGHPWYITASTAIFFAFASNALGGLVSRPEYLVAGWYALGTGILALFFLEGAPWLWTAVIWGGTLIAFALAGLAAGRGDGHG